MYLFLSLQLQIPNTVSNMLMRLHSVFLALLAASTSTLSSPLRSRIEYAVKDTHRVPSKWHNVGPAPAHKLLHLHVSLKQSQFDELERHLYEGMSGQIPIPLVTHKRPPRDQSILLTYPYGMISLDALPPSLWPASH